jgi:hypothetical protein
MAKKHGTAAAARKPYSRPAPAPTATTPEGLATDMAAYALMFETMGKMLQTDSGKNDTQMHQVCRWYADQIQALDKKVPVLQNGQTSTPKLPTANPSKSLSTGAKKP